MTQIDDETTDGRPDPLICAVARTPDLVPFAGTDRYRVCSCLGEGGFGVVFEVEDRTLGRRLALKTLKPDRDGSAAVIRQVKREFRTAADLVHPNLVGLHELSSERGRWFFTMDLVRGCDFLAHVRGQSDPAETPDRADESRLRAALGQLVAGVHALHQAGIVHRDLKPSNVLVEPDGHLVILDFGLAAGHAPGDGEGAFGGTPLYMAPEQAAGRPVTGAADWYAVGVMLHEALTGERPLAGGLREPPGLTRTLGSPTRMHLTATATPRPSAIAAVGGGAASVPEDLLLLCAALLQLAPEDRPDGAAILKVLGEAPARAATARAGHRRTAFVGRRRELAALEAACAAVRGGEPLVVRIHGEPGVGKSALLAELTARMDDDGRAVVLAGRCHERESVPFKAFDAIADALVRRLRALPRDDVSALLPRDMHLVSHLFPAFEGVAGIGGAARRRASRADPREVRQRAFAALKELIARLAAGAAGQALVIAIDDLQWGDLDSARLLSHLIALPDRPAILLVLCYRADDAEHCATLRETLRLVGAAAGRTVDLEVGPLPAADAEDLAARLLGRQAGTGGAAHTIARRGEGHPLFIAELARAFLESGDRDAGAAPTLLDILWQRVLRLPRGARSLLETVVVAGGPFPSHLSFEAAGLHGAGVDAVRVLRAEQLVRASDGGDLNVFHDRIRDAVLARAEPARRRQCHLALARALERRPGSDPEALARHFDAAGEPELAARHALRAADAAMEGLAFERAAALYHIAIDGAAGAGEDAALREKLADALLDAGRSRDAGEAYLAAAARARGAHRVDLIRRAAEHLLSVGDTELGQSALAQALAAVGQELPATRRAARVAVVVETIRLRLRTSWRPRFGAADPDSIAPARLLELDVLESAAKGLDSHDPPRALVARARHYRMARRAGDPRRAALGLIGSLYLLVGHRRARPARADALLDAAEAVAERLSDPHVRARAILVRGKTHFVFGNWQSGAELCERAAALVAEECVGMTTDHHDALLMAALCRGRAGQLTEARRLGDVLMLDAIERGDPVAEKGVCAGVLAPLALAADEAGAAQELLDRVGTEDRCAVAVLRSEMGAAVALYRGDPRAAVRLWRQRWPRIAEMGALAMAGLRVISARSFGTALIAHAGGADELDEARRLTRSIRPFCFPFARAAHASLCACLALRDGQPDRAAAMLDEAARFYGEASMRLEAAACRHRAGQLVGGDQGGAASSAALEEMRALGIARPDRWAAMLLPAIEPRARAG